MNVWGPIAMAAVFSGQVSASQVGSYFVTQYYHILQQQPNLVYQFHTDASTMVRIDGATSDTTNGMMVENEYGNVEWAYGIAGAMYVKWAADTAVALNTTVPWIMCQQGDAPDPIINTCNGFYCDTFTPNPSKPKMWTENYPGWFSAFGYAVPFRPVEDIAFSVARFFETGGTYQNYYMYFGGTNFGRTAGGPLIATIYDYDAPIDEYGFLRQPKWNHLRDLYTSIKLCEEALVSSDAIYQPLGINLEFEIESTLLCMSRAKTDMHDIARPNAPERRNYMHTKSFVCARFVGTDNLETGKE